MSVCGGLASLPDLKKEEKKPLAVTAEANVVVAGLLTTGFVVFQFVCPLGL